MLVGKDISKLSYPKTIKMNRIDKNAILIIAVERGNEIEVEYSKNHIIMYSCLFQLILKSIL